MIKENLKKLDNIMQEKKPNTMDEVFKIVNESGLLSSYGYQVQIVGYMGVIQGIVIKITGNKKNHYLPSKDKVYSVFNGLDKYIKAGWRIVPTEELEESI